MAHFARLDKNNVVVMVTVISNDDLIDETGDENEAYGVAVCESVIGPGPWVQTSFNGNFRHRYAGIGFIYNSELDVFVPPKPYASWVLNDEYEWQAPSAKPEDGQDYEWNESSLSWDLV